MGQVDLMIWWNGTETIALFPLVSAAKGHISDGTDSDTFEIAMLMVNRNEKLIKTRFSRVVSFDILKWPRNMSM